MITEIVWNVSKQSVTVRDWGPKHTSIGIGNALETVLLLVLSEDTLCRVVLHSDEGRIICMVQQASESHQANKSGHCLHIDESSTVS